MDLRKFAGELVDAARESGRHRKPVEIEFDVAKAAHGRKPYFVLGHDLRLGQVLTNLIENARSFVAEETGRISISLSREGRRIILTVDDNGPGIRADNID